MTAFFWGDIIVSAEEGAKMKKEPDKWEIDSRIKKLCILFCCTFFAGFIFYFYGQQTEGYASGSDNYTFTTLGICLILFSIGVFIRWIIVANRIKAEKEETEIKAHTVTVLCKQCGAPTEVLLGEVVKCEYCDSSVKGEL